MLHRSIGMRYPNGWSYLDGSHPIGQLRTVEPARSNNHFGSLVVRRGSPPKVPSQSGAAAQICCHEQQVTPVGCRQQAGASPSLRQQRRLRQVSVDVHQHAGQLQRPQQRRRRSRDALRRLGLRDPGCDRAVLGGGQQAATEHFVECLQARLLAGWV
jgi:hypothetical protein